MKRAYLAPAGMHPAAMHAAAHPCLPVDPWLHGSSIHWSVGGATHGVHGPWGAGKGRGRFPTPEVGNSYGIVSETPSFFLGNGGVLPPFPYIRPGLIVPSK